MKKNKWNLGKWISGLCSAGVAVMGFGCSSEEGSGEALMYGTPTSTFEIKGSVTDMDGKAVGNATIRVTLPDKDSGLYSLDSSKSDTQGAYKVEGRSFPLNDVKVVCIPEQPALEPDSVVVELNYIGNDKDKPWYEGHAEKKVDFKLKEKKNAE